MTTPLFIFLLFLLTQRFVELAIARRHAKILKGRGAVEVDRNGYKFIVMMHAAFFISLILESIILRRHVSDYWILLLLVFGGAQVLRYWAIGSLGVYWNTKILVAPDHRIIRKGPYRFIRHPNYLAVIIEMAVVPLVFSCYATAVAFSFINAIVLKRRIRIETDALINGGGRIEKMPDGVTT